MAEITLRDYFAAHCPESEIPKMVMKDAMNAFGHARTDDIRAGEFEQLRARARYLYADRMIEASQMPADRLPWRRR